MVLQVRAILGGFIQMEAMFKAHFKGFQKQNSGHWCMFQENYKWYQKLIQITIVADRQVI